jgi:hypothetical protein
MVMAGCTTEGVAERMEHMLQVKYSISNSLLQLTAIGNHHVAVVEAVRVI